MNRLARWYWSLRIRSALDRIAPAPGSYDFGAIHLKRCRQATHYSELGGFYNSLTITIGDGVEVFRFNDDESYYPGVTVFRWGPWVCELLAYMRSNWPPPKNTNYEPLPMDDNQ